MFSDCKNLIEIDFSHFQCSNYVESFEKMFYNCKNLTSLDVSHLIQKIVLPLNLCLKDALICKILIYQILILPNV